MRRVLAAGSASRLEALLGLVWCWCALFQGLATAYSVESLSRACGQGFAPRKQLRLTEGGAGSAVSLAVGEGGRGAAPTHCGLDVHAPDHRVIAVQVLRASHRLPAPAVGAHASPCPLAVFSLSRAGRAPRRHLKTVDLCDEGAIFRFSEVFPRQHLSLVWMPPFGNFSHRLQASEIIVTALGNGSRACQSTSHVQVFPCWRGSLCTALALVCDGRPNCPDGDDEDPQLCPRPPPTPPPPPAPATSPPGGASTTVHFLVNSTAAGNGTSLYEALSQYGPWGFVMLGMLVCGSVLMICGVWECCCLRSETPGAAAPTLPSVFIIGSSAQREAAAPPSYDDLDQPPAYSTLFPSLTPKDPNPPDRY